MGSFLKPYDLDLSVMTASLSTPIKNLTTSPLKNNPECKKQKEFDWDGWGVQAEHCTDN